MALREREKREASQTLITCGVTQDPSQHYKTIILQTVAKELHTRSMLAPCVGG